MADFTIVNGTSAELTNVNAGGVDVPANSIGQSITLTGAELLVVAALSGVAVLKDSPTNAERRAIARGLKYFDMQTL